MIEPPDRRAEPPDPSGPPGLRHDVSSPLTVIRCHAQLARQRLGRWDAPPADRERLDGHLRAIEDAVDRIVALLFPERFATGEAAETREDPPERTPGRAGTGQGQKPGP